MESQGAERGVWILRSEHQLLVIKERDSVTFPMISQPEGCLQAPLLVGEWAGLPCFTAEISAFPQVDRGEAVSLRAVFGLAGPEAFALAGRAMQLLDWQKNHRFCGHCGTPTVQKSGEFAMQCPACQLLVYPRLSPAIMVLIRDGQRVLLARSPHFKPGVFSALAGFVEPGESLEACVVREVREEVGLEVCNLRYFSSQPWPFPNSLMLAFFADYAGGRLSPDPKEIEAADWFSSENLPILPDPISISRQLIDAALLEIGTEVSE